jgi:hypothetical protein
MPRAKSAATSFCDPVGEAAAEPAVRLKEVNANTTRIMAQEMGRQKCALKAVPITATVVLAAPRSLSRERRVRSIGP